MLPEVPQVNRLARPFSNQARDTILLHDRERAAGVISLFGGKLTAYRSTAEEVAELVQTVLAPPTQTGQQHRDTADIPLR